MLGYLGRTETVRDWSSWRFWCRFFLCCLFLCCLFLCCRSGVDGQVELGSLGGAHPCDVDVARLEQHEPRRPGHGRRQGLLLASQQDKTSEDQEQHPGGTSGYGKHVMEAAHEGELSPFGVCGHHAC